MDLSLTKDQEMIRKSAREFFKKECSSDAVREMREAEPAYDKKLWKKMVKLGYPGLALPEAFGGSEGDFIELALLMEEIGRAIAPSPFFAVMQCALPLLEFGTDEQKEAFLPAIAEKGQVWALAHAENSGGFDTADIKLAAVPDDNGFILDGTKLFVPYAGSADRFLVTARSDSGIMVFMVDAGAQGVDLSVIPTVARDNRCEVRFDKVRVGAVDVLGSESQGDAILDAIIQQSAVLKAAEMYGASRAALELAVAYTKERRQFDRPLASFQAVQHRLVNLLTEIDGLKYLVYKAAWGYAFDRPDRAVNSAAKLKANRVHADVCRQGMYLHGAIGWTEEMDIGLFHRQTRAMVFDGCSSDMHREIIAGELENRKPLYRQVLGV